MTETTKRERAEAWLAEAGEEPTPFGKAVIEVGRDQGIMLLAEDVSVLDVDDEHFAVLLDHMAGTDFEPKNPPEFVQAVAAALGLDYQDPADYEPCMKLAYTNLYKKPYGIAPEL